LGQIAGVASGGYSCAVIISDLILITTGRACSNLAILLLYAMVLTLSGVVNSFSEVALTALSYISIVWQILGVFTIVIWMIVVSPDIQSPSFVFLTGYNNDTGFSSYVLVALIGSLAAA
jgi:hypothetical protein